MAKPLGSMFIELGLDTSQFNPKLHSAKRAVNYFRAETRGLDAALKVNGKSVEHLGAKYKSLQQMITAQKNVLASLKKSFDNATPGTDRWEKTAVAIERENAQLKMMENQLNQVSEALKTVHAQNSRWGKLSQMFDNGAERAKRWGENLRNMGDAMKPVSTLLSAGFALATRKAMDFEGQMQVTKSLLADTAKNTSELNTMTSQLGESSKKWAREYGISTSSINEGMQEIIKKGFDFNQTIAAMPAILDASKASGEDFNTVMNASTNILQQFGLQAKDTGRITDVLTYVANKTAAGFGDMGNAMEYVGPVAKNVGMSLEETAAAVGLLSNNGIAGEKAGTALRGALSRLLDPSKEAGVAMKKLGFSADEFKSGAIKLPDILDRIKQNTQGMTDAQKSALIAQAFGIQSQTAMNILVDQGGDKLRALTEETKNAEGYTKRLADEMQKSGKSSAERFKSSLEVLQITIGQKLLPILTPFIEKATKLVEQFAKADPATQKFAIGLGLILAGAYPVLNALGNVSTVTGSFLGLLGKMTGKLAIARTGLELLGTGAAVAGTGIGAIETAAVGTTGQLGLLAKASAFISNPAVLVAGGLAIAGGLVYWALKAGEAEERTKEWGTAVSETEADALSRFKTKVDQTNEAMTLFEQGAGKVETVKKAFDDLAGSIEQLANDRLDKDLDTATKLGLPEHVLDALKRRSQAVVDNVNGMSKQVKEIYDRHNGDVSKLTQAEKELVLRNQNEMIQEQLQLMHFSAKERKALTQVLNGELDELNIKQLDKALQNTNKMLEDENTAYRQRKKELKETLARFGDDVSQLDQKDLEACRTVKAQLEELEANHNLKTQSLKDQWVNIQRERVAKLRESGKDQEQIQFELATITQALAKEMGISYEEASKLLSQSVDNSTQKLGILSNNTKNATAEVAKANEAWDSLFTSANPQESLNQLLSTAEGWNEFELMVKHADVNPIGRAALAEMLVAGGQWQEMTLEQKMLVVDGQQAMIEMFDSKELLEQWQALTPEQKQLLAQNLTAEPTLSAQEALDSVRQKEPAKINAKDETSREVDKAKTSVNSPKQVAPVSMLGRDDTAPSVASVTASVNSPRQNKPVSMKGKDDTRPSVSDVNQHVNSPRQNSPVSMYASDNTAAGVNSARANVNSVQNRTVYITTVHQVVGGKTMGYAKGTDYHRGGLAMVNDQKGSLYKELVTLPSGEHFIPEGRNVILPLPRGSKVLTASRTKSLMERLGVPKYAQGVGIPEDAKIFRDMAKAERQLSSSHLVQPDNSTVEALLREIIRLLATQEGQRENLDVTVRLGNMTLRDLTTEITKIQDSQRRKQFKPSYT